MWGHKEVMGSVGSLRYPQLRPGELSQEETDFNISSKTIIAVAKTLKKPTVSTLYADHWFLSISLEYLRERMNRQVSKRGQKTLLPHNNQRYDTREWHIDIFVNNRQTCKHCSRKKDGLKTETESLVEETSAALIKLALLLAQEVARIALLTPLPLPDPSFLKPGPISRKLIDGLKSGLECLIKECEETAAKGTSRLRGDRSLNSNPLVTATLSAANDIADFLKKYAELAVTIEHEPIFSSKDQKFKLVRWMDCIESVAETLSHLNAALMDVVNHTKLSQEGNIHADSTVSTRELLKRLKELLGFAGIGLPSVGGSSLHLLPEPRNNSEFVDELHKEGVHAIKAIEKLEALFIGQSQSLDSSTETPIKYKEKILTQWPKNSDEFQMYLKQNSQPRNSPSKNSFQSSIHRDDKGKKVRFNVSHTSSVSYQDSHQN
ncbi:uncharacterized protein LOC126990627 [Eriocheir sinensis]|uniref:uncharacterized protein LOC126990627 n=1 Tax=Eriocheir sinensis TaxID=95602 RepID=UPI0021CA9832|nr:uncharacterized protein LOC126990627 [Eriocheir sinensis]